MAKSVAEVLIMPHRPVTHLDRNCFTICAVEHLLNLLWLLISVALLLTAVRAHARGQLRCSLPLAVCCTALLALLLFPALSMTDDLQRARLDVEDFGRHLGATLLLGSPDVSQLHTGAVAAALLLLAIASARRKTASSVYQRESDLPRLRLTGVRPEAVRPPPAFAC